MHSLIKKSTFSQNHAWKYNSICSTIGDRRVSDASSMLRHKTCSLMLCLVQKTYLFINQINSVGNSVCSALPSCTACTCHWNAFVNFITMDEKS
ncbi:hypothetical protein T01_8738 [Trichinella spiralis]|uniref:Uncharacterized protein n=1 Tax=Trichinella spiralis TaxID=6334 RepID=A0A0V1AQV7_TRISP|nr:hypothetical protein T01_8738 [Trichinella spiralis]